MPDGTAAFQRMHGPKAPTSLPRRSDNTTSDTQQHTKQASVRDTSTKGAPNVKSNRGSACSNLASSCCAPSLLPRNTFTSTDGSKDAAFLSAGR